MTMRKIRRGHGRLEIGRSQTCGPVVGGGVLGICQGLHGQGFPCIFQANEDLVQPSRPCLREDQKNEGTDGASKHIRHQRSSVLVDDILDPSSNLVSEETEILGAPCRGVT